jgi:FAD/FMN-containing dehydrogenases
MDLLKDLATHFPEERLKTKPVDRYAYASDASFYTLVPAAIVFPASIQDIQTLLQITAKHNTTITFRAAGTSLSGQSVTNGILADISKHWRNCTLLDNGEKVKVQPGIIGNTVNHYLRPYGRKIGPDPASINSAMMGGILSNNSSGMCCGVQFNSYHTLASIEFMLPNGMLFNTGVKEDYERFEKECAPIYNGLLQLQQRVQNNESLIAEIRRKYRMKNTVGYGINAFLDYQHPLDILAHLLIGAEGTLGFIASAVMHTIPDKPFKGTALLCFASPKEACNAIWPLKQSGAEALEFMDRAALYAVQDLPKAPAFIKDLPPNASCILCEYQGVNEEELQQKLAAAADCLNHLPVIYNTGFTTDLGVQGLYWKLRKGLYPSVAAVRAKGTAVMLEDVAVPVEVLGEAIESLQQLFIQHGYHNAIVFGHAKEGNLHFLISQPVNTPEEIRQFEVFNDHLAQLICDQYKGSLKAEHGTGRQIAPYVEAEWGSEAYAIMKALKQLVDEKNILNQGVIINHDKQCHIKNLKSLPIVEEEVDKCVECGYCEHRCPSRDYTVTPRQRIVLRRALARLKEAGDMETYNSVMKDYQFPAMDTCAVDGMCATDCPVSINTGELVKRLRRENHSSTANKMALQVAKNFKGAEVLIKTALRAGHGMNALFGNKTMSRLMNVLPAVPQWPRQLAGAPSLKTGRTDDAEVIYFVTCINRLMGADVEKKESAMEVLMRLAQKAGIRVTIPNNIQGHCCGQAFSSKGFYQAQQVAMNKTIESLWEWTRQGAIPVMADLTSCTYTLQGCRPHLTPDNQQKFDKLTILDTIDFAADHLLPRLTVVQPKEKVVFHPVCSVYKMGLYDKLMSIGKHAAKEVVVPFHAGCCGMAGDRGFYYPGLVKAAIKDEINDIPEGQLDGCYSTSKTCEMALSEFSRHNYRSVLYLLDEVTA